MFFLPLLACAGSPAVPPSAPAIVAPIERADALAAAFAVPADCARFVLDVRPSEDGTDATLSCFDASSNRTHFAIATGPPLVAGGADLVKVRLDPSVRHSPNPDVRKSSRRLAGAER